MLPSLSSFSFCDWVEIGGALLVASGCLGELWLLLKKTPTDKKELETFESRKHFRERIFVGMVAVGVTLELIALPISLRQTAKLVEKNLQLEHQIAQTSNNVVRIDPRKQPIAAASAIVWMEVRGTNRSHLDPVKDNNFVVLKFGRSEQVKSYLWKLRLVCKSSEIGRGQETSTYSLEFGMDSAGMGLANLGPQDSIESADGWDIALLQAFFLRSSEILRGSVSLVLNSAHPRTFPIPRQHATWFTGNPTVMPSSTSNSVNVRVITQE